MPVSGKPRASGSSVSQLEKSRPHSLRRAFNAGEGARVETALSRLAWIGRESSKGRLAQGDAHRKRGDADRAARAYRRAIDLHPSPRAWQSLGAVLASQGRWRGAVDAYSQSLALDPGQEMLLHDLGVAHLKLDQPELALAAFERAAEINPDRGIHQVLIEKTRRQLAGD